MGSLKSHFLALGFAGLVGTAAVVGCSASGTSDVADSTDPNSPADGSSSGKLPAPSGGDGATDVSDPGKDAGKKAPPPTPGFDAGPPPPVVGDLCPTIGTVGRKTCGACGTAETLCLDDGTGKGKWGVYGACFSELAGGCIPGATQDCGNCGKQTCGATCSFATCAVPPASVCAAGTTEYSSASCPVPATYRNRTCSATCAWGGFTTTCAAPVNEFVLNTGAAVAAITSTTLALTATRTATRLPASACPLSPALLAGTFPYQYVELHNPTAKAAVVSVSLTTPPGGAFIQGMIAVYATPIQPMDDTARKACRDGVAYSSLSGVAIPAGGSVLLFVGSYYASSSSSVTTGNIVINTSVSALL